MALELAWQLGALSVADLVVLWVLIAAATLALWRVRPLAGTLLVPYLAWVSFAVVLNFAIWRLNSQLLS